MTALSLATLPFPGCGSDPAAGLLSRVELPGAEFEKVKGKEPEIFGGVMKGKEKDHEALLKPEKERLQADPWANFTPGIAEWVAIDPEKDEKMEKGEKEKEQEEKRDEFERAKVLVRRRRLRGKHLSPGLERWSSDGQFEPSSSLVASSANGSRLSSPTTIGRFAMLMKKNFRSIV